VFQLTRVELLWGVAVIFFFSSIAVLTTNDNFWVVPALHSVSDMAVSIGSKIFFFPFGASLRLTELPEWAIIYYKSQAFVYVFRE